MDHSKKLDFIHKMSKLALDHVQHFDDGGSVLSGPSQAVGGGANTNNSQGLLGGIAQSLGTANNFQAGSANVQAGTNANQLNNAYQGAQNALGQQNALAGALNPGLSQGANTQSQLTGQLQGIANGTGPNPAMAQLNQQTGKNVANQAALMAGQRGAGANVGLLARQAAQQGANTQQQAVGQGATMQAQQALAAQSNLQNLAAQQIAQSQGAVQGLNNAQQNEQNVLQGANTAYNSNAVGMQSNLNNVNAQTAMANQQNNQGLLGTITKGVGGALGPIASLFGAEGGQVTKEHVQKYGQKMAEGGITGQQVAGPQSFVGQWLTSSPNTSSASIQATPEMNTKPAYDMYTKDSGTTSTAPTAPSSTGDAGLDIRLNSAFNNGQTANQAAESPSDLLGAFGERAAAKGGLMKTGGPVKAKSQKEKAVAPGNNYANDKIPAMLSEGEIVLPRSVTMHKMAPEKAAEFVRKTLAKKGLKR